MCQECQQCRKCQAGQGPAGGPDRGGGLEVRAPQWPHRGPRVLPQRQLPDWTDGRVKLPHKIRGREDGERLMYHRQQNKWYPLPFNAQEVTGVPFHGNFSSILRRDHQKNSYESVDKKIYLRLCPEKRRKKGP